MTEYQERALAIIDRLREENKINNREMGCLRRAIIDNAPTVEVETCINYKLCKVRKQCELQKAIEDCED